MFLIEITHMVKGFKIIGLAVDAQNREAVLALEASNLLGQAAWYPNIPSGRTGLNVSWLWCPQLSDISFRPLSWVDFGGPGGERLPSITGLSVQCSDGLYKVEFHYSQPPCVRVSEGLGWCNAEEFPPSIFFKIDGGSGEYITAINIATQKPRTPTFVPVPPIYPDITRIQVSVL